MEKLLTKAMQNILHEIEEGIHIIDRHGVTVYYNHAMEKMEGLGKDQVVGRHLLEVYPDWSLENSTLLMSQKMKRMIAKDVQSYINFQGKTITTQNITFPIMDDHDSVLGSVEIAKNYTHVSQMSDQIRNLQNRIVKKQDAHDSYEYEYFTFDDLLGRNKEFLGAIKFAKRAAENDSSVLIQGETGTGKEMFAQSIHSASPRKDKPFIAQNCAALPDTLLEGILFGTTKGSFTGAENKPGLLEQASGGTMFLDEINSMSDALQAKLLRVLQEGYVRRVGGQKDIRIDVRVIAAANVSLIEMVRENRFRRDLYYRINVINIVIPPLRERSDDIPLMVDHFLRHYNKKLKKDVWMVSQDLAELFTNYPWRGNVRELKNFIESSMNMVDDEHVITREHLPGHMEDLLAVRGEFIRSTEGTWNNPVLSAPAVAHDDIECLNTYLEEQEKNIITYYYKKFNGNITQTSKQLRISRQNLQYKLKKLGLQVEGAK